MALAFDFVHQFDDLHFFFQPKNSISHLSLYIASPLTSPRAHPPTPFHQIQHMTSSFDRRVDDCWKIQSSEVIYPTVGGGNGHLAKHDTINLILRGGNGHLAKYAVTYQIVGGGNGHLAKHDVIHQIHRDVIYLIFGGGVASGSTSTSPAPRRPEKVTENVGALFRRRRPRKL